MGCVSSCSRDHSPNAIKPFYAVKRASEQPYATCTTYEVDPTGKLISLTVDENPQDLPQGLLWDMMLPAVQPFYKALHRNVCEGVVQKSISFRWFCDSPTARAEMVMVVERTPSGAKYTSCTLAQVPHQASFLGRASFCANQLPGRSWTQCCQCLCFKDGEAWLTPEQFYHAHVDELQGSQVPVSHVFCEECVSTYAGQSEQMRTVLEEAHVPIPASVEKAVVCSALVVDDDVISARIVAALLSALHCSVEVETSSPQALNIIKYSRDRTFDMLVADHIMPELDGSQLIRALREAGYPGFIIGVSGTVSAQSQMTSAGANLFLWKPVRIASLSKALKSAEPRFSNASSVSWETNTLTVSK